MDWAKRAQVTRLSYAELKRWKAKDAPYAVVLVHKTLDGTSRWLAIHNPGGREEIISRHRIRRRAEESCIDHAKRTRSTRESA